MFHGHGQLITALLSLLGLVLLNMGQDLWAKDIDVESENLWKNAVRTTGTVDRIKGDRIIIDDQEFLLTSATLYLNQKGQRGGKGDFTPGDTVFYVRSEAEKILLLRPAGGNSRELNTADRKRRRSPEKTMPRKKQDSTLRFEKGVWRN